MPEAVEGHAAALDAIAQVPVRVSLADLADDHGQPAAD
jgi:hypothetical protein